MSVKSPLRARRRTLPEGGFLGGLIDPIDSLSETIFRILILLTFTLAFRLIRLSGNSGQVSSSENVNELLIGALGAVLAWGVIDGVMYALIAFFERGERHRLLWKIQTAESEPEDVHVAQAALPPFKRGSVSRPSNFRSDRFSRPRAGTVIFLLCCLVGPLADCSCR